MIIIIYYDNQNDSQSRINVKSIDFQNLSWYVIDIFDRIRQVISTNFVNHKTTIHLLNSFYTYNIIFYLHHENSKDAILDRFSKICKILVDFSKY